MSEVLWFVQMNILFFFSIYLAIIVACSSLDICTFLLETSRFACLLLLQQGETEWIHEDMSACQACEMNPKQIWPMKYAIKGHHHFFPQTFGHSRTMC